jgi:hypothetical protein
MEQSCASAISFGQNIEKTVTTSFLITDSGGHCAFTLLFGTVFCQKVSHFQSLLEMNFVPRHDSPPKNSVCLGVVYYRIIPKTVGSLAEVWR